VFTLVLIFIENFNSMARKEKKYTTNDSIVESERKQRICEAKPEAKGERQMLLVIGTGANSHPMRGGGQGMVLGVDRMFYSYACCRGGRGREALGSQSRQQQGEKVKKRIE
jgi:hypothetical protein